MSRLSTAQVAALETVAGASSRGAPFIAPSGPRGRPYKFIKNAELVEERPGGLWITERGREELEKQKGGSPP